MEIKGWLFIKRWVIPIWLERSREQNLKKGDEDIMIGKKDKIKIPFIDDLNLLKPLSISDFLNELIKSLLMVI